MGLVLKISRPPITKILLEPIIFRAASAPVEGGGMAVILNLIFRRVGSWEEIYRKISYFQNLLCKFVKLASIYARKSFQFLKQFH